MERDTDDDAPPILGASGSSSERSMPRKSKQKSGLWRQFSNPISAKHPTTGNCRTKSRMGKSMKSISGTMVSTDDEMRSDARPSLSSSSSPSSGETSVGWFWQRLRKKRRRQEGSEKENLDQEFYIRSILESYCSSIASNRYSATPFTENRASNVQRPDLEDGIDDPGGVSGAYSQMETTSPEEQIGRGGKGVIPTRADDGDDDDDEMDEKHRRRLQRQIWIEAMRSKLLEKNLHRARTRKKMCLFLFCIMVTLTAFIVAAVLIAHVGVNNNSTSSSSSTDSSSMSDSSTTGSSGSSISSSLSSASSSGSSDELGTVNTTFPPLTSRSGVDLLNTTETSNKGSSSGSDDTSSDSVDAILGDKIEAGLSKQVYTYVHCVLMSLSLWMSLVVIGMHITFRSFRTYSMAYVLELSCVQCGYWITSLLRVLFVTDTMNDVVYLFFCMAECFFNFAQISFTCAIAFNMYRSVVSYADVLVDSGSAKRKYRSYTMNVMLLSVLAAITLALMGYRSHDDAEDSADEYENGIDADDLQPCLYPTCRLILYVYYPLMAFGFNFIFYFRFKRTIGDAYPMSATGRLNKVARSYLILFFICWGSLITLTAVQTSASAPNGVYFVLQCIFDFLGVGTAAITLTNFHRCRKAFDFGLSLKAIDPNSIEFEDPVKILGEGTFAIVVKARWHQGMMDNSISRTVEVAVKTFKHTQFECLDQMKEEAYLSSKLVHPCVMMTYGCYTNGSNLYIVYEYLGGGTLQDVLDANTNLPYEQVLRYAHMIAMGMRFLHGLPVPIIHRDLKPLNCIFDSDQEMLKVADFGESRLFRKKDDVLRQDPQFFPSADLTLQMTTNIGSACWAAPEVLKDEATSEYSVKVDVYSFGIVCWQLYTCKLPYADIPGSVLAVAEAVIAGHRPQIPSDCPNMFAKIMTYCWRESANRRPSFEDIVQLLEMELDEERQKQYRGHVKAPRKIQLSSPASQDM